MSGRTANISTSSFQPLDLQEIMMVPLAKQKMEDELLNESAGFGQLSASTLSPDQEKANKIVNDFKERASNLSQEIIDRGVSREQFNKLRNLKNEVASEFGENGFVGRAVANKNSAMKFINELATKKERQGGYSPEEARQWAQSQVYGNQDRGISGFQGTQNEDGSFNSFAGREMFNKVDEDKLIDDAIKRVEGDISKKSLFKLKTQGLLNFYNGIRTKETSGKDFNTVMASILSASRTNPDLRRHLEQQAFFTGEEDPTNMGSFGPIETVDEKGNKQSSYGFIPGKSRYGQKMLGFGRAASSKDIKYTDKFFKDDVKVKMWEDGYQAKELSRMMKVQNGEYLDLKSSDLPELRKMSQDYGTALNNHRLELAAMKKQLEDSGKDPSKDRGYQEALGNYTNSKTNFDNHNNYINQIEKESLVNLNKNDRALLEVKSKLNEYNGDVASLLQEEYDFDTSAFEKEFTQGKNNWKEEDLKKYVEKAGMREVSKRMGVSFANNPSFDFDARYNIAESRREDLIQDNFDANKKAMPYRKVIIPKNAKYSGSKFRVYTGLMDEFLNPKQEMLANESKVSLDDYIKSDDFKKIMGDDNKKGYTFTRSMTTDGYNKDGVYFDEILIKSKEDDTKTTTVQVENRNDIGIRKELYELLLGSGDFQQSGDGEKGLANMYYMPVIKKSNLRYNKEGSFMIPLKDGNRAKIKYSKNPDGTYSASMFGVSLDINGDKALGGEQAVAVAIRRALQQKEMREQQLNQGQ